MLRPSRLPIVKNDADLDSLSFFSSSAVAASAALATITSLFAVAAFSVAAFSAVVASSCPFFSASCQRGPHRLRSFLPSPSPTRPSPTPRTCVRASRCQTELAHHPRIRISPVDCCWYCSPPEKWLRLQAARPKRRSGSVLSLILQRIPTPSPLGELAIGTSTNLCDSYLRGSCSPSAEGRRRKAKGEKAKRRKGDGRRWSCARGGALHRHSGSVFCALPSAPGSPATPRLPGPAPEVPPGPTAPFAPGVRVAPMTFGSVPTNAMGAE